ncbi:amidase signature domain-containing protein [Biscogniauxia sp. FL1348]|nr:amidase signature domain-containing protein [Biscogniauxia sp. FL1348]
MSLVVSKTGGVKVTKEDLKPLLSKAGLELSAPLLDDFSVLVSNLEASIEALPDDKTALPRPDLAKYPRSDIHVPRAEDNPLGAWAVKVTARCTSPSGDLLKGRTVALKDNMAFAGVRCTNGTAMVEDWVPEIDATIATWIMDAGATILGKAACENSCMQAISGTSVTGVVHNPHARGYSAGGSSSGSGALVAAAAVDLAIGCDQGGSIRIPASCCGIVGLKPTWGLVPYTGIASLAATIDHAGPMARTVRDCALLLEAVAGADGWDDRQPPFGLERDGDRVRFVRPVDELLLLPLPPPPGREDDGGAKMMLEGVRVGVLSEGFAVPDQDENVVAKVREAVERLAELGAAVRPVSVPLHAEAPVPWMCALPLAGAREGLLGDLGGRKQLHMTDRTELVGGPQLKQEQFDALGPGAANMYVGYLWVREKYGAKLHGKCMNVLKKISDAYDAALEEVDVLVMPTLPHPPPRMAENGYAEGPLKFMKRTTGLIANTCPFNNSGHPALSLPVGFVPAREDPNVKLPVGMQIVGRKFADVDCLKVAAAWEKAYDWKTF